MVNGKVSCCLCLSHHSLYNLSTEDEFKPLLSIALSYILRAKYIKEFPFKYVCLDCIIQIHNSLVFLKKAKNNLKKLLEKNKASDSRSKTDWKLIESDEDSHYEDEVFNDIGIISNWIDSQADYLRNLDTLSEKASQTSVSCFNSEHKLVQCSVAVSDLGVQTIETYSIQSNNLSKEATEAVAEDHETKDKVGSQTIQKKRRTHSPEPSTSEPKRKKEKIKIKILDTKASGKNEKAKSNASSKKRHNRKTDSALQFQTAPLPQNVQVENVTHVDKSSPSSLDHGLLKPISETKNKKLDRKVAQKEKASSNSSHKKMYNKKNNSVRESKNVPLTQNLETENFIHGNTALPSSIESGLLTPVSEPIPNQDYNKESFDCKNRNNQKTDSSLKFQNDPLPQNLQIENVIHVDISSPSPLEHGLLKPISEPEKKESDTKVTRKKEKARSYSSHKKKNNKNNSVVESQNVPLGQNLETENVIHVHTALTSSLENGLLTPVSEPISNQDHNKESFDCKIDICEADLKTELISPLNQTAIDTPAFDTPRTSSLVSVTKTQILKVCSVCDHQMYSSNEVRRHRKTHMQCNYCKKKFKSLTQTHVHSFYECDKNPLRCNVFLTRLDTMTDLNKQYPVVFSQIDEVLCAAKKKVDKCSINRTKV